MKCENDNKKISKSVCSTMKRTLFKFVFLIEKKLSSKLNCTCKIFGSIKNSSYNYDCNYIFDLYLYYCIHLQIVIHLSALHLWLYTNMILVFTNLRKANTEDTILNIHSFYSILSY